MTIKDYIASGIIESYVMGLATDEERAEFERMCIQYPELVAERTKFEESLESFAAGQAELPPGEVRTRVLEAIASLGPAASSRPANRIVTMENAKSLRNQGLLRFVAAAAIILLVGMIVLYVQVSRRNDELTKDNEILQGRLDTNQAVLDRIKNEQKVVGDPNAIVVNMTGTKIAPRSSANVYWDSTSSAVYLVVKNMPKLPSDRQYQLWALIDNGQKDLGVFDGSDSAGGNVILKMNDTKTAQAFAITIEKKGGSPHPTLDSLQSVGKTALTQ